MQLGRKHWSHDTLGGCGVEPCSRCLFSQAWRKTSPRGFKLSVRVEPLFRNLTLAAQIEKVAEAGYQGFEFGDWRAADSWIADCDQPHHSLALSSGPT